MHVAKAISSIFYTTYSRGHIMRNDGEASDKMKRTASQMRWNLQQIIMLFNN